MFFSVHLLNPILKTLKNQMRSLFGGLEIAIACFAIWGFWVFGGCNRVFGYLEMQSQE
ncbi:MAG: hypothetical protein HC903_26140 [Methylacidiphilales bacterium]|nr:hypothetical protein [Candidatus Methylacidiphilales bacterium]